MDDQALIRRTMDDLADAIRRRDADAAVAPFADVNVMYVLPPPLQNRSEDASPGRPGVESWFAIWEGPIGYERRDVEIHADGDVAFAYGLVHLTGRRSSGGAKGGDVTDLWFRETLGFCRLDETWQIVHEHQSVPFLMDGSDRAALDLTPE